MPDFGSSVFSQTDANNNSGTMPSWSGSAAPSTLDDAGRAFQGAATREWNWRNYTLTTAGTTTAYTLTYSVAPAAYYNGQRFAAIINATNTGSSTLNVNSLGAVTIKKVVAGTLTNLSAGDLVAGKFVELAYNTANTCFVWVNQGGDVFKSVANTFTANQTITGSALVSGTFDPTTSGWTTAAFKGTGAYGGALALVDSTAGFGVWTASTGTQFNVGQGSTGGALSVLFTVRSTGGVAFNGATNYGTSGQYLKSNGDAPPTWATISTGSVTALGTITTTSGTSQSLSSLTLTGYKFLRLVFNGVSAGASGNLSVGSLVLGAWNNTTNVLTGIMDIDLTNGVGHAYATNAAGPLNSASAGATGYSTATTTVTLTSGTTFDAGSVLVYGMA